MEEGPTPAPVALVPLAYASPRLPDPSVMPPRLVVIGVISLIWGATALYLNIHASSRMYSRLQASIPPPPLPPPAVVVPPLPPYDGDFVREMGLKADERNLVCDELDRALKLSPDRRLMLDRFLSDAGQELFGPPPLEAPAIRNAIIAIERPSRGRDGAGKQAPHMVVLKRGRLELNNSLIVFTPNQGTRISLEGNYFSPEPNTELWGARALEECIPLLSKARSNQLTAQQVAALLHHAAHFPAEPLNNRDEHYGFARPVRAFHESPNHWSPNLFVDGQWLLLLPNGASVEPPEKGWFNQYSQLEFYPFMPAMLGSLSAIRAKVLDSILQSGLALLLLLAGLLTLVRRRGAAKLHRLAALLWIPATIGFLFLLGWFFLSLFPSRVLPPSWAQDAILHSISFGYAIAVLLVMRSRPVREHYAYRKEEMFLLNASTRQIWRQVLYGSAGRLALFLLGMAAAIAGTAQAWALMQQRSLLSSHFAGMGLMATISMVCLVLLLMPLSARGGGR